MHVYYFQSTFCSKIAEVLEIVYEKYNVINYSITQDEGLFTLFVCYTEKED